MLLCDRESESGSKTERKHLYTLKSLCYKILLIEIIWKIDLLEIEGTYNIRKQQTCGSFMFFSVLCLLCLCACLFIRALWSLLVKG